MARLCLCMTGSSPRMWGTPPAHSTTCHRPRFIPTHVGNTRFPLSGPVDPAVHPHACGEHPQEVGQAVVSFGSSPRMWGTRNRIAGGLRLVRFIPTHVGNTLAAVVRCRSLPVHPHACGEHWRWPGQRSSDAGSSPRMWGTLLVSAGHVAPVRFIPTHVGNTQHRSERTCPDTVHPHACGEHQVWTVAPATLTGSSPRMWGTPEREACALNHCRFIPTHVGNTISTRSASSGRSVHPHACGEHTYSVLLPAGWYGSSPRMWGTLEKAEGGRA